MKIIEEIIFKIENGSYNKFVVYRYEEEIIKKVKTPCGIGENTLTMEYKYEDVKIKTTKYAIHRETECNGQFENIILCETECYSIVLKILKDLIEQYINQISRYFQ